MNDSMKSFSKSIASEQASDNSDINVECYWHSFDTVSEILAIARKNDWILGAVQVLSNSRLSL